VYRQERFVRRSRRLNVSEKFRQVLVFLAIAIYGDSSDKFEVDRRAKNRCIRAFGVPNQKSF
jgi:hypothetical protein